MTLQIDSDRIASELETLARFSDSDAPAVTRVVFSSVDLEARRWLKALFADAGLAVREDAVGNTFARWKGSDAEASAVGTGSHVDAIPNAGKYDGTVGVLGGLEAIRALQRSGWVPRRSIELVLFTSEEPTRFGIGCLGSRLLSGSLTAERAASLRDGDGLTLEDVLGHAGLTGGLASVRLSSEYFSAFIELHIEQGAILEREKVPIGIVTDIAAPATLRLQIEGEGGHAGAVMMPGRKDAFVAAAEIALEVEKAAYSTGSADTVATTGFCRVFPNAVNSIPSRVTLEIDVRDVEESRRNDAIDQIQKAGAAVAEKRGIRLSMEILNADRPAHANPVIVNTLSGCCEDAGYPFRKMISRAYHDSLFMARVAPTGMIFIPCRDGISHRPDEYASPNDIAAGVNVLGRALARLAG